MSLENNLKRKILNNKIRILLVVQLVCEKAVENLYKFSRTKNINQASFNLEKERLFVDVVVVFSLFLLNLQSFLLFTL